MRKYTLFELMGEIHPHEREIRAYKHLVRKQEKCLYDLIISIPRHVHKLERLKKRLEHEEHHAYTCPWCHTRVRTYNEHTGKMECSYCDYFYAVEDDEDYWEDLADQAWDPEEEFEQDPEEWAEHDAAFPNIDVDKDTLEEAIKRGEGE